MPAAIRPIVPGILLKFSDDELEQEWRQESNLANERGDSWWFWGLIIWGLSIVRRWQDGGDMVARDTWFSAHVVLCTAPLLWKFIAPGTYTKYRIPLLATVRCLRAVGVATVIGRYQNYIWKPASGQLGCPLALFVSQYMKLAYLLCQVLAHQVPLIHHIWLISLNVLAVLISVPGRCQAECSLSIDVGNCSMKWFKRIAVLDKYWMFSASNPASMENNIEPWQACTIIQSLFAVSFAIGPPLLYYAAIEEHWRKNFLLWRGGIPNFYNLQAAIFLDTLLSILAISIIYSGIRLFV